MKRRVWIVAGLVLAEVAVCAGLILAGWNSLAWLRSGEVRLRAFEVDLVSAQAQEEQRLAVSGPVTLSVENRVGDVIVTRGSAEGEVVLSAAKTAWGPSQAEAEARLADLKVTVTQNGSAVSVTVEQPQEVTVAGQHREGSVDFTLQVPAQTVVTAHTAFGSVTASGLTGAVDLRTSSGPVAARQITGSLTLRSDFGGIVVEDAAATTVDVNSNSGELRLDRVQASGAVTAHSDFGKVSLTDGHSASLDVSTNSGEISLTGLTVEGQATVHSDFGALSLTRVEAQAYDLSTNSGGITVDGAGGRLKAKTDFGSLALSNVEQATLDLHTSSGAIAFSGALGSGPHSLTTDFGDVRLTLPAGSALTFDLSTRSGQISSEFPVTMTGDLDKVHWRGTINGGGESLTVHTSSGDIALTQAHS